MLPVTRNTLRHVRIQPLFFLNIDLLVKSGKAENIVHFIRNIYNPEAFLACHLLISGNYQTKSGGRDIFQVCKVKYQACCARIKC